MTTAYSAAIKITFDKPIITNPEIITGSEYQRDKCRVANTPFSSGDYSSTYNAAKVFDDSTSTYWRSASTTMPQYIGTDFGTAQTFTKARVYLNSNKPGAYQLQGSNDNSEWTDIATGTFTSTTGWQDIIFSPATFRYWRLYCTTRQSTYCYVYEIEFWGSRSTYDTSGWAVTGYEPSMVPGDSNVATNYTVYRVTKTEDNLSIILWLDLMTRIRHPQGEITVVFTGDLRGEGNVSVVPFAISFTPENIDLVFNPQEIERVEVIGATATAALIQIYYTDGYTAEHVEVSDAVVTATLTHINDLP